MTAVILLTHPSTLCTSGFVGEVMFSHNGANRPESSTTLCFVKFA